MRIDLRLGLARVLLSSLALVTTATTAAARTSAPVLGSFRSGGRAHPLQIDVESVAIRARSGGAQGLSTPLPAEERAAFATMGIQIVPRQALRTGEPAVGVPIWFDRDKGAVGVLTSDIVVRVASADGEASLHAVPEIVSIREAGFRQGVYIVRLKSPIAALAAANALYDSEGIAYAHPNFMIPKVFRNRPRSSNGPETEPFFYSQWHLENTGQNGGTPGADIHVRDAWEITRGDSDVIVAVIDGGFELTHPDLDGAWWHNPGEIPGNGVDDDNNGYVDDVTGWNYWSQSNDPSNAIVDDHGTAVAGLVGARFNGRGMTGVCPSCTILPVVASWEPADDAAAFYYAARAGAGVITNSWGYPVGTPTTDVVEEAIATAAATGRDGKGAVILFAMNNFDQDDCIGSEPDISSLDAVVAVSGASDQDKKVSYSAWGDCMEIISPTFETSRQGISTTDLTGRRGYNNGRTTTDLPDLDYTNDFGGTSAATPISAGVFALVLSVNPELTRDEALSIVLSTTDKVQPDLAHYDPHTGFSKKYGYGRINAGKAVRAAQAFKKYTKGEKRIGAGVFR
jgi:subtilisin family serine protease